MPATAVRWGAPRSGESRVAQSQSFHHWRFERNQVEEARYVRQNATLLPRATNEPIWDLKPAPDAPRLPDRPSSAPHAPRRSMYSTGAVESEGMRAVDLPVSRADRKTYAAQVERLRSGGVRLLYPKPEPGTPIVATVPSHIVSPRPGRPPLKRPTSARGPRTQSCTRPSRKEQISCTRPSRKAQISTEDPRVETCLNLLVLQPSDFCTLILCGSKDVMARTHPLRDALKAAYPQAPVGVSKGKLRPGTMEIVFFSSCDFSITPVWTSPARTLKKGGMSLVEEPEPGDLVRLISEQCAKLALKLEESKKRLQAATCK